MTTPDPRLSLPCVDLPTGKSICRYKPVRLYPFTGERMQDATFYTIGHSSLKLDEFLLLLHNANITGKNWLLLSMEWE